jgi:hypothetical protein
MLTSQRWKSEGSNWGTPLMYSLTQVLFPLTCGKSSRLFEQWVLVADLNIMLALMAGRNIKETMGVVQNNQVLRVACFLFLG